MKRNAAHSRSSIFLMEIILAICFFSLVSAVCLQVFVRAKQYSQATTNLNMAVADVQTAAEIVRSSRSVDETLKVMEEQYPDGQETEDGFILSFDRDWNICQPGDKAAYQVKAAYRREEDLASWTITASAASQEYEDAVNGGEIYRLDVEVYEDGE